MKDAAITAQTDRAATREAARYREMAESCRRMAAASHRPGPLLLRAEHYEHAAADLVRSIGPLS
jgi:hypothetical protein